MAGLRSILKNKAVGGPIVAVATGSGIVARSAVESGADMIIVFNASIYRNIGIGSLGAYMPFGNANDQTEQLLEHNILPRTKGIPVMAGVLAGDPTRSLAYRLKRLEVLGVEAVTNWPAVGFFSGNILEDLERRNLGIDAEIEMLKEAQAGGFAAFGFAVTAADAARFAAEGMDGMILNVGLSREFRDSVERRNQVRLSIAKTRAMVDAVRSTGEDPLCLVFGGAITRPIDFEELIQHVEVHGFAGGSVFERIPVANIVESTVRRFRGVTLLRRIDDIPTLGTMIGGSVPMKDLFDKMQRVAPYDVNVHLHGESGTGKELAAAQLHALGPRAGGSLITLNCGAIPDTLVESDLFGHEEGAYTGADHARKGKFELAHNGTLFLDEVGDLSPHAQTAMLRAIQEGEVLPIGGQKPISVNVRIVSASNKNLLEMLNQGDFREDLFFRLTTVILELPPLRTRSSDIKYLVKHILARLSLEFDRKIQGATHQFMKKLEVHCWPGNIRELEQVLTRAALFEDGSYLEGREFQPLVQEDASFPNPSRRPPSVKAAEANRMLGLCGGNKSEAARRLGISRKTLYAWLRGGVARRGD